MISLPYEGILFFRVFALYGRDRRVGATLVALAMALIAAVGVSEVHLRDMWTFPTIPLGTKLSSRARSISRSCQWLGNIKQLN